MKEEDIKTATRYITNLAGAMGVESIDLETVAMLAEKVAEVFKGRQWEEAERAAEEAAAKIKTLEDAVAASRKRK